MDINSTTRYQGTYHSQYHYLNQCLPPAFTYLQITIISLCAIVYTVTYQPGHVNQHFIASRSQLAKQNLAILKLELIDVHMAFNLADKIQKSLTSYDVRNIHGWTDSTVLLYHEYTMQNVYANPIQELWWTGHSCYNKISGHQNQTLKQLKNQKKKVSQSNLCQ